MIYCFWSLSAFQEAVDLLASCLPMAVVDVICRSTIQPGSPSEGPKWRSEILNDVQVGRQRDQSTARNLGVKRMKLAVWTCRLVSTDKVNPLTLRTLRALDEDPRH